MTTIYGRLILTATIGSGAALLALLWNLHRTNPDGLLSVAVVWAVVLAVFWVPKRR